MEPSGTPWWARSLSDQSSGSPQLRGARPWACTRCGLFTYLGAGPFKPSAIVENLAALRSLLNFVVLRHRRFLLCAVDWGGVELAGGLWCSVRRWLKVRGRAVDDYCGRVGLVLILRWALGLVLILAGLEALILEAVGLCVVRALALRLAMDLVGAVTVALILTRPI